MNYIDKILMGILVFPLIAIVFTLPYAIYQYHKYGSVSWYRTLIIYSFILYMLIAYFQIMLPLPALEATAGNQWRDHLNLIPFRQIWLYWHGRPFSMAELQAYSRSFSLWQLLLNILLTVPYGVYLRYYFKQDLKHTILYSFLLSLFYELTQLSALYGIYPGPYRLADVEDLICNTLGGVLGYQIAYIFALVLPSRDRIDAESREAGRRISGPRRFWAVLFDYIWSMTIYLFLLGMIELFFPKAPIHLLDGWVSTWTFYCLFSLASVLLTRGFTLGHAVCRMILVSREEGPASAKQMIRRYFYLWMFTDFPLILAAVLRDGVKPFATNDFTLALVLIPILLLVLVSRLYFVYYFFHEIFRKRMGLMPHDRLSGTLYISTRIPDKES